jgi:hypothetical protein
MKTEKNDRTTSILSNNAMSEEHLLNEYTSSLNYLQEE